MLPRDFMMDHLQDCLKRHVEVKFVEAYDFGLSSPTCYMLAFVDEWGRVFVVDGFYRPSFHYTKHGTEIERIRNEWSFDGTLEIGQNPINADPSIYKHRTIDGHSETGQTVSDLITDMERNLRFRPANNDIVSGIAKVGAYLADKDGVPHPTIEGRDASPLIFFSESLDWYVDEVVNYYWMRDSSNRQIDEPQKHNDHAMDTKKYLLSFLPPPSEIKPPKPKLPPAYLQWHEVDEAA